MIYFVLCRLESSVILTLRPTSHTVVRGKIVGSILQTGFIIFQVMSSPVFQVPMVSFRKLRKRNRQYLTIVSRPNDKQENVLAVPVDRPFIGPFPIVLATLMTWVSHLSRAKNYKWV